MRKVCWQMQIVLSKDSDVPLRQQLAEQIVFLITTGQLQAGAELPSVRALGRLSKVHHNTVSEAYQDLMNPKVVQGVKMPDEDGAKSASQ